MTLAFSILLSGCVELVLVGHSLVAAGKAAEHLLGYYSPSPTPSPEK